MTTTTDRQAIEYRSIEDLKPNPLNPRQVTDDASVMELSNSILEQGILQPLLITPDGVLITGHRRLAAARLAAIDRVPVIVRHMAEAEQVSVMLVENLQREDLSPLQEARAYNHLVEAGVAQADIERRIGVPKARIRERLTLLRLDPQVAAIIDRKEIPPRYGPELAKVTDIVKQRQLALICVRQRLTLDRLRDIVDKGADILRPETQRRTSFPSPGKPSDLAAPVPPGTVRLNRKEALNWLQGQTEPVQPSIISAAFEDTCCACGMSGIGNICNDCPLPQFVSALKERDV